MNERRTSNAHYRRRFSLVHWCGTPQVSSGARSTLARAPLPRQKLGVPFKTCGTLLLTFGIDY
jgi:hypothetical protein